MHACMFACTHARVYVCTVLEVRNCASACMLYRMCSGMQWDASTECDTIIRRDKNKNGYLFWTSLRFFFMIYIVIDIIKEV
jgi:hypothetical protein